MKFGDFFKQKRLELGLTLRKFSEMKGVDAAYISRIENNLIPAPLDKEKLRGLAIALQLEEGSGEWVSFFDYAAASRGLIPEDISERIPTPDLLPAFFRAIRNDNLTQGDVDDILKLISGDAHDPKKAD